MDSGNLIQITSRKGTKQRETNPKVDEMSKMMRCDGYDPNGYDPESKWCKACEHKHNHNHSKLKKCDWSWCEVGFYSCIPVKPEPTDKYQSGYTDGSCAVSVTIDDQFICTTVLDYESLPNKGSKDYQLLVKRAKWIAEALNKSAMKGKNEK